MKVENFIWHLEFELYFKPFFSKMKQKNSNNNFIEFSTYGQPQILQKFKNKHKTVKLVNCKIKTVCKIENALKQFQKLKLNNSIQQEKV